MGFVAEYHISCAGLPFVAVAAAVPEATLEIDFHPSEERYAAFLVRVPDGAVDAVERAFDASDFVGEYTRVQRSDRVPRYRVEPARGMAAQLDGHVDDVGELQKLAAADASIQHIRAMPTGWVQAGWFADRETLDRFRSFWDRNCGLRLRRLTPAADSPDEALTDAQREAVRTAYEMGYFEVPRGASLDDVAAELDIAASSLSERLRRAQTGLVETTIAGPAPK